MYALSAASRGLRFSTLFNWDHHQATRDLGAAGALTSLMPDRECQIATTHIAGILGMMHMCSRLELRPIRFLTLFRRAVRHGDTASIYDGFPAAPAVSESFKALPGNKVEVAPDGKTFAVLTIQSITIYDCATEQQVRHTLCISCPCISRYAPSGQAGRGNSMQKVATPATI